MKRYLTSQASLKMAHRSKDSELVGRVFSQQDKKSEISPRMFIKSAGNQIVCANRVDKRAKYIPADTYHPTQIEKFYRKWGKRE